jgi:hypothetical protein
VAAQSGAPVLSISLSTNTWSIGSLPKNGVADTWYVSPGTFAVTNTGSVAVQLLVSASNTVPSGWVLAPVPGFSRFQLAVSVEVGGTAPAYRPILPAGTTLAELLATNSVLRFDLRFHGPQECLETGEEEEIPISVVAVPLE